jgi:hypothetical protein
MHEIRRCSQGQILGPRTETRSYDEQNMDAYNQQRFLKNVEKTETCWPWTGLRSTQGYGRFFLYELNPNNAIPAHRVAFHLFVRPLQRDELVLHSCDNKWCVNPAHLRAGDHWDNARDASERKRLWQFAVTSCPNGHPYDGDNLRMYQGRRYCAACKAAYLRRRRTTSPREWAGGIVRGKAALTKELAEYVIRSTDVPRKVLAEQLGVSRAVIDGVKTGRTWKELPRSNWAGTR